MNSPSAPHGMTSLDWAVIAAYVVGMIGVGVYYSLRTRTTEDYLLGGRKMKPLGLGLSLFATMLSAITYLAFPGEIIRYGPILILGKVACYPFVALVVGWLLIPFIMRMRITSAYEMLEERLGLGVRMLGSTFFLALRLMWMAVVIFATADKVLVPLLGLAPSATPYLCAVLGAITVAYTSMGGLRAVVFTDVAQTCILFGGALLTLAVITVHLGGLDQWWPDQWPAHWPEPVWGYDPDARVTFFGAMLATLVWYICTTGSDQMAIQRYLATRNVREARKMLIFSLAASVLASILLSVVGLALLGYFQAQPELIPGGELLAVDTDRLFPRFFQIGLPPGLTGLVMAGLLAASMSSLSSGVSASCSVITVDFLDRFRRRQSDDAQHIKTAKIVSVFVGIVVILLSSCVTLVEGNLLELAYKICNLLTAPLFGLFFMAMFVRRATGFGTMVGAAGGLATVVAVNFWKDFTGTDGISFIWAMPLGLFVQISLGTAASLLPVGQRR